MHITHPDLAGLMVMTPDVFRDERGFFTELWNRDLYQSFGLHETFVQDNVSFSKRGVVRGLHFQNPNPQGKLVRVLAGEVFDVAVDLRQSSPTFGKWWGIQLSGTNHLQVFVPAGFAHGFQTLSETALFHYKCTSFYRPADARTIRWNDPDIGVSWPLMDALLSSQDADGHPFRDLPSEWLFP